MPGRRTSAVWLIGWLALALALRLAAAVVVDKIVSATPNRLCLIEGDAEGYWQLGEKIARGGDYSLYDPPRQILRMPGFPLLLAACRLVFGDQVFPVRCMLALVGTLGCGCVYVLARDLADPTVALWACATVSLSPPLIAFTPLLLTETTFAVAMVASLIPAARLVRAADSAAANAWLSIGTGFAIALAAYVRPTWLPAAVIVAAAVAIRGRFQRAGLVQGFLVLASCAIALAPWTYRNFLVSGHVVPTTLWVGASLYDGLNPKATGDSDMTFFDQENLLATMTEYEVDQEYRRRAWSFVADHPARTLQLAAIKAGRYWSPWPNAQQFNRPWLQWGLAAATLPLYGFAIFGLWQRRRDVLFWLVTLGPAVFFCLVHLAFVGSIRYRLPADYVMWIAASVGGAALWRQCRDRAQGRGTAP